MSQMPMHLLDPFGDLHHHFDLLNQAESWHFCSMGITELHRNSSSSRLIAFWIGLDMDSKWTGTYWN
jgi:hypothetical protein